MNKKINGDEYTNFDELRLKETLYEIWCVEGSSGVAVIAPHGGKIEPGTSEIARGIAGAEHTFYSFVALRETENKRYLHLTSTNFDEPIAVSIVQQSERVIAIHGCKGESAFLELGGLDKDLKELIDNKLSKHFKIREPKDSRPGERKNNICNRGKNHGVQIEISKGLRDSMFAANTIPGRLRPPKENFIKFVSAVREAIEEISKS